MGAMLGQQAVSPLTIAEEDKIFAEQLKGANSLLVNLRLGAGVSSRFREQWGNDCRDGQMVGSGAPFGNARYHQRPSDL